MNWRLSGGLLALGLGQAYFGIMRHRFVVFNWLASAYLTLQVVTRQATRLGATLPKRLATGEVVSVNGGGIGPDLAELGDYFWNVIPLVNLDIVRETLASQDDIEILAEVADPEQIPAAVRRTGRTSRGPATRRGVRSSPGHLTW